MRKGQSPVSVGESGTMISARDARDARDASEKASLRTNYSCFTDVYLNENKVVVQSFVIE